MGGPGSGSNQRNELNPYWKGGISPSRLRRFKKDACERCGSQIHLVAHHKDEDRSNNQPSNQETLCRSCHALHHDLGANREGYWASSYRGVTWHKHDQRWQAQVKFRQKNYYLGQYKTEEEAYEAVQAFKGQTMIDKAKRLAAGHACLMLFGASNTISFGLVQIAQVQPPSGTGLGYGLTEKERAYVSKVAQSYHDQGEILRKLARRFSGKGTT